MHTAVFDIGKTNKKFSIFDENLQEIHRHYITLPETKDEDGFPTEDLPLLTEWMQEELRKAMQSDKFHISKLNFSTYGASFVHLNECGLPVAPLYNYLKPFPEELWNEFYQIAGTNEEYCVSTASPALGMLNSGLQLYWLQKKRPEIFEQIKYSLHFPQYCSYLFSKYLWSDFTSIGCHTGLWDFTKKDYHTWVKQSGIDALFPSTVLATHTTQAMVNGQLVEVGTGIHDSSAALLPYIVSSEESFLLLSTGTWNITFNPFSQELLTSSDLHKDCLNYMRMDGLPVKASRLFFGSEFNIQTQKMTDHFGKTEHKYHHTIIFDEELFKKWNQVQEPLFHLETIQYPDQSIAFASETRWDLFPTFEDAYHRFMIEMMHLQTNAIQLAAGSMPIQKLYVDGGFTQNDLFVHLLRMAFPTCELIISPSPLGSSLGAAMAINSPETVKNYTFGTKRVTL
ncbi:MAG: FGGY family carbohydrate kinase [Bacteroidota bacterium]